MAGRTPTLAILVFLLLAVGIWYLLIPSGEPDYGPLTVEPLDGFEGALTLEPTDIQENAPALWDAIQEADETGLGVVAPDQRSTTRAFLEARAGPNGSWYQIEVAGKTYSVEQDVL